MSFPVAFLDPRGDFAGLAVTHRFAVDRRDGYYSTGSAGDKNFRRFFHHFSIEHRLLGRNTLFFGQIENGLTGDAFQDSACRCQQMMVVIDKNSDSGVHRVGKIYHARPQRHHRSNPIA